MTIGFRPSDLAEPIILAPMAGGPTTPALVAAVSNCGGLGFLAAGYRRPEDVRADIAAVRDATQRPFGLNLFVPSPDQAAADLLAAYASRIRAFAAAAGYSAGEPRWEDDSWEAKLELALDSALPVVSFTFGCPPAAVVADLQRVGTAVWVTVTDVADAEQAAAVGADALVVQGLEAGGHRGSFTDRDGSGEVGLLPLIRLVSRAVDLPLIASGGIGDGRALAAVLVAGAAAGQLGSAFMLADEAGTSAPHRAALGSPAPTALTRAFSGRRARGIVNRFMVEHGPEAPSAYPQVHHLTSSLRAAARAAGDADLINLWAGQAYPLAESLPAAEIVHHLALDCREALMRVSARLGRSG